MYRILVGLIVIVCLVLPLSSCGGDKEEQVASDGHTHSQPAAKSADSESRSMIPPKKEAGEKVKGAEIKLFLDEAGSATELSVATGQTFDLYVFAQYPDPYNIAAAEFSLSFPAGVKVVGEKKFKENALSMGNYSKDYVIAFECEVQKRFYLVKYTCSVDGAFNGGKIEVKPGVNATGLSFLGFATCQPDNRKLEAVGGSITLTKK